MSWDVNVRAVPYAGAAAPYAGGRADAGVRPPAEAGPPGLAPLVVNPSLRLDPELGLVVIEFRDEAGQVTGSIPSQRQIEAYRRAGGESASAAGAEPQEAQTGAGAAAEEA